MSHNIQKRGSVYYFRRRVPDDLLDHYNGKREIVRSLRVKDRPEAMALARKEAVDLDDEWQRLRSAPKPVPERPANAMTAAEFEAWDRARFEAEEEWGELQMQDEYQQEADEEEADRLERVIRIIDQRRAAAGIASLNPAVRAAVAHPASLPVPREAVPARTPAPPAKPEPTPGPSLSSFLPIWARERNPAAKTFQTASTIVAALGDPDVTTITRRTIIEFRDKLLDANKARGTINNRLSYIHVLLGIAKDRGYIEVNHAADSALSAGRRAVEARMPYTPAQIQAVLSATEGDKVKHPASYWLPRLGLWTGARLNELHQLRKCDIQERDGVPGILITDDGDSGQGVPMRLKNAGSRRWVPLAVPVREFAQWVHSRPDGPLFPARPNKYGIISDAYSRRYGPFLRNTVGITDKRITFHSWRHTFADLCRAAAVPPEVRMALMGHAEGGAAGAYGGGGGLPPKRLIEAINRLSTHSIDSQGHEPLQVATEAPTVLTPYLVGSV